MKGPLVTVVVPVYKARKYISTCLDSLMKQTYERLQIVVVDDGCPEGSHLVVDELRKRDSRIELIRQKNKGLAAARNSGISMAKGEYILFLDSDDTLVSLAIQELVALVRSSETDAVFPDKYIKVLETSKKRSCVVHFAQSDYYTNPIDFALNVLIAKGRAWRATSVLYRKDTLCKNNILFPPVRTQEDFLFNLRFLSRANKIEFCPIPTQVVLRRDQSLSRSNLHDLLQSFMSIDESVRDFLVHSVIDESRRKLLLDSLMCRNAVIVLTAIVTRERNLSLKGKYHKAKEVFRNPRIREAFRTRSINLPYFPSKAAVLYFRVQYSLIRWRIWILAFFLVLVAGLFGMKDWG